MPHASSKPPRPRQLTFDLGLAPALGRDDFLEADENRLALELVESWPDWPSYGAVLVGPPGSGKSHLAAIWRAYSEASEVKAAKLSMEDAPRLLEAGACVVEDLDAPGLDERALFHFLNFAREEDASLLLLSRKPPTDLPLVLPDLASRLKALPAVAIEPPGDDLLQMVLVKLLADRQLMIDPGVLNYLALRMERSLGRARDMAERLDHLSLEKRQPITKALALRALNEAG